MSLFPDGKIKKEWTNCPHGFWACWVCHAYGIMLGQDLRGTSKFEPKDIEFLKFGFANLHLLKNGLDHFVKYAWNRDFKSHQCRYIHQGICIE